MLPIDVWLYIALRSEHDEHVFNALVRAVPYLGRWTIAGHNGDIVGRRLDLMIMFGYSVQFASRPLYIDVMTVNDVTIKGNTSYIIWYKNGLLHRNDGPAMTATIDDSYAPRGHYLYRYVWMYHGQKHRWGGPAVEFDNLCTQWQLHGQLNHTLPGSPTAMGDHTVEWHINDFTCNEDGPATIYESGLICWYKDAERHRIDGPAVIYPTGDMEFCRDGKMVPFCPLTAFYGHPKTYQPSGCGAHWGEPNKRQQVCCVS